MFLIKISGNFVNRNSFYKQNDLHFEAHLESAKNESLRKYINFKTLKSGAFSSKEIENMAEANNQNEPNLEDKEQRTNTYAKEQTDKSQGNHNPKAEKPTVYKNYGGIPVKPLLLRNHHWSTKDIKDKLSTTAQVSDIGHNHSFGVSQGNYANIGENIFKRQDSITSQNRAATACTSPTVSDEKTVETDEKTVELDGKTAELEKSSMQMHSKACDVTAEVSVTDQCLGGKEEEHVNIHSEILTTPVEPNTKYSTDNTLPTSDWSTDVGGAEKIDPSYENSVDGKAYELEYTSFTEEEIPGKSDSANADPVDEPVNDQCNLYATEENVNEENQRNQAVNEAASVNNEEIAEARQLYHEERRDENIDTETSAEGAENQNEDQNDEQNIENPQVLPQDGSQTEDDEQNVEQSESEKGKDDSDKKDDETEAWTQEEIQALLRKAINLHASEKDLKTIINCGGNVNKPIKSGLYPLHYAAYTDYPQCIEVLLNFGANVNVTDDIGYTPLHLAARRGNHKSLEVLIENGAIINYCESGVEIHQTDEKNKLGYTTMEPINLAIQNCHPKCARLLLEHGARPNNKYFMGYEICLAPLESPECLELLLEFGADPNVFNRCGLSPLMKACKDHHIEAVRKLLKYGADVNALCPPLFEQKSVLQFAISSGNIVIINILLGKGAKVERQGEYRYSALHTAVMKGRADICRLLLQHGADANEKAEEGATPMMLACSTPDLIERREIVQLLLDCGADINAYSPNYSYFDPYLAPLTEYFKCIGQKEGFGIVRLMIRNGATINFCSSGLDSEMKRLRDPFSIVPYVHCLQDNQAMFEFVVSAAAKYSPLIIYATHNIPEDMKDSLIFAATRPRNLKHLVRATLRSQLTPGLPDKVEKLPLPPLLKSYLLFR